VGAAKPDTGGDRRQTAKWARHRPRTVTLRAIAAEEPYPGVGIERDVNTAPPTQLLDIFVPGGHTPPAGADLCPWRRVCGRRQAETPTNPFYDNIMLWAAKNGFVGVNVTYPRPGTQPARLRIATAVLDRGQDRRTAAIPRIYLMGHSAGAVHVSIVSHRISR
jgi:triacylglycerol lipase